MYMYIHVHMGAFNIARICGPNFINFEKTQYICKAMAGEVQIKSAILLTKFSATKISSYMYMSVYTLYFSVKISL